MITLKSQWNVVETFYPRSQMISITLGSIRTGSKQRWTVDVKTSSKRKRTKLQQKKKLQDVDRQIINTSQNGKKHLLELTFHLPQISTGIVEGSECQLEFAEGQNG